MSTPVVTDVMGSPPPARRAAGISATATILAFDAAAIVLWLWGSAAADSHRAGALGLVQALPVAWWAGVAAATLAFVHALRQPRASWLLYAQPALLIAILYGTPSLVEAYARNPVAYTHVGLVEHVARTGELLHGFDARYEWPGSIALGGALTTLTGVDSATAFLKWSPVFFALIWSLPVYVIGRSLLHSTRAAVLAVWLTASVDWVGQEYWSPQAVNFFLLLAFVAIVLRYVPRLPAGRRWVTALIGRGGERDAPGEPVWDLAQPGPSVVVASLVVITAAVAISHQLTPFVLVILTIVLVVVARRDLGVLPLVTALLAIGWFAWGAVAYWDNATNQAFLTHDIGNVSNVLGQGVFVRVGKGTGLRLLVLIGRVVFGGGVWAAGLWVARRNRRSRPIVTLAALLLAPIPLVAVQGYGGELVLRLFLFGAPFAAMLIAGGALASFTRPTRLPLKATAILVALVPVFMICRYGNEAFEQMYPEDVAAAEYVYAHADRGTIVVEVNPFSPYRTERVGEIPHKQVLELARPDKRDAIDVLRVAGVHNSYLLITHGQDAYGHYVQGGPTDWVDQDVRRITESGAGYVLFRRGQAVVLWIGDP